VSPAPSGLPVFIPSEHEYKNSFTGPTVLCYLSVSGIS
jgi:hypothetical protein